MSEAAPAQTSGGGEGPPAVPEDIKTVEQTAPKVEAAPEGNKIEQPQPEAQNVVAAPEVKEVKPEVPAESKPEEPKVVENVAPTPESKPEEKPSQPQEIKAVAESNTPVNNEAPQEIDWQQKAKELLTKVQELEKGKSEDGLKFELKVREEEIDLLKARVKNLETELQAAMSKPGAKNQEMIDNIKQQHEELLSKARGMIFDKTKMVKNQELQIEALTTQVQSLKDINLITKDLLEIRNAEVKAMEDRLAAMEARFKAEKERHSLVLQRAQTSSNINDDLRKEYETQLAIFKELREKYELRVKALVAENERLKAQVEGTSTTAPA